MKYLPVALMALLVMIASGWLWLGGAAEPLAAAPLVEWDARLDGLGVTWQPAAGCSEGCWRLRSARLLDPDEGGGNHHVYVRLYRAGNMVADLPFHVSWADGGDRALSKVPPEWADIPIWNCYYPENGAGPYRAFAGDSEAASDVVHGMGLPVCYHYSFQLEWEWAEADIPPPGTLPCTGCFQLWLPLFWVADEVTATPTPEMTVTPAVTPSATATPDGTPMPSATPSATPSPSPTVTPTPGVQGFTGEVVQTFTNCALTQVFGTVRDPNGTPLPGTRIRLTWDAPDAQRYYTTAGSYIRPETDESGWEFFLNGYAVGNGWRVAVVDGANNVIGEELAVQTDGHCNAGAANVINVRFTDHP